MSDLKNIDSEELKQRIRIVLTNIDVLCKEIGPKVQEIGSLRLEADIIYNELVARGIITQEEKVNVKSSSDKTEIHTT